MRWIGLFVLTIFFILERERVNFRDFAVFANSWNGNQCCPRIDVYRFDHWEGGVDDPNSAVTTVLMDSDKTITAVFVIDEHKSNCLRLRDFVENWLDYKTIGL